MAQKAWWVVAPANGFNDGTALHPQTPANSKIVEADVGTAAYNAWLGNGSYKGWQVYMGPFPTQQAAKNASPASGLGAIAAMIGAGSQVAAQTPGLNATGGGIAAGIGAVADTLGGFNLGSWFLRIGEILLGLVLVGVGVARITGVQNAVASVVKTKLPIPV
jgi:hypothetical protein